MKGLENYTIKSAHDALKSGETTARALAEASLSALEEKEKDIHAYLEVFDDVLDQAEKADELLARGEGSVLTGIPLAVKDNILIEGRKVSAASKILEGYHASYDATAIARLKEEHPVFIGRTNMDEFAMGASTENSAYTPTKNPLDQTRVPGGSSGGSAASVAMHSVLGALGSDTAGSIRQPASFCGLVGLKPTYGSVSRHGLIALGSSLDVIGPMTKTVEDAEILFNTMKGKDTFDATSVEDSDFSRKEIGAKIKVGVLDREYLLKKGISNEVIENYDASIEKIKSLGYELKEIVLPHLEYAVPTYYVLLPAEASSNLARFDGIRYGVHQDGDNGIDDFLKTRGQGFGREVRRRILVGTYVLSAGYSDEYYKKALSVRDYIRKDFYDVFREVDVVMTPTTATSAFRLGEKVHDPVAMYLEDIFTVPANLAGIPAITIPSNWENKSELPLGIQYMSPHMHEDLLFTIGKDFEK